MDANNSVNYYNNNSVIVLCIEWNVRKAVQVKRLV